VNIRIILQTVFKVSLFIDFLGVLIYPIVNEWILNRRVWKMMAYRSANAWMKNACTSFLKCLACTSGSKED